MTQLNKKKKGTPLIVLSVILTVLIYAAAGFGIYTYKDRIKELVGLDPGQTLAAAEKESESSAAEEEPVKTDPAVSEESADAETPAESEEPASAEGSSEKPDAADVQTAEQSQDTILPDSEPASSADFLITPEFYAGSGGSFKKLGSGERIYTFDNGEQAKGCWVEEEGKFYYIDYSGCVMLSNCTEEGFTTGSDGSWDDTVPLRTDNTEPVMGQEYGDDPKVTVEVLDKDGYDYTQCTITYSFGYSETYRVTPLDNSVYLLTMEGSEDMAKLMSVSMDQKTIRISGSGETAVYELN